MKIKRMAILLLTVIMTGATALPSYAAEDLADKQLNINDVLKTGDIYENKISDGIAVKEVVTKIYEDGTFDTQPIGDMLLKNATYSNIEFETEDGECLTVYLRNGLGEETEYIEKILAGDVIQASISEDNGIKLTALEVIVAINAEGGFMTKHINRVDYD